jgi:hypothetical protein
MRISLYPECKSSICAYGLDVAYFGRLVPCKRNAFPNLWIVGGRLFIQNVGTYVMRVKFTS